MTYLKNEILSTGKTYNIPSDVLADIDLVLDQKIDILSRWKYDVIAEEIAENEAGMLVRQPEVFDQLLCALHTLDARRVASNTPLPK